MENITQAHNVLGTSLQGYVVATFEEMVAILGAPHHENHGDKCDTEWNCRADDGIVFTVYDYDDTNEDARDGSPYKWHIGGFTPDALRAVERNTGLEVKSI